MISSRDIAAKAVSKVRTPPIPYVLGGRSVKGTDCINMIGWCVQECGGRKEDVPRGSNTAWRTIMKETWTLAEAKRLGKLVPGACVYIKDAPTTQWPDGDYRHSGLYTGKQAGWAPDQVIVHASASRGGVYPSTINNGWTHVAWLQCVDYENKGTAAALTGSVNKKEGFTVGMAQVTTDGGTLNIRKTPSTTAARLAVIPNGVKIDLTEIQGDWAKVKYSGVTGWVLTEFLTQVNDCEKSGADSVCDIPLALREKIEGAAGLLQAALQMMGGIG